MRKRHLRVGQQTWALLCKNWLKKVRMRRETAMEWFFSFLLIFLTYQLSSDLHQVHDAPQIAEMDLGRVDDFNDSSYIIAFAPETKTVYEIMNKVASAPFMKAPCETMGDKITCRNSIFWERGFVAFQAAINAGIIEMATNHSVMEELMSLIGSHMKILPFISQGGVATDFLIFFCVISFSSFIYHLSINITQERQYITTLMATMGLRESAFWLSWGLMYAVFILVMATLMSLIVKSAQIVVLTGFMVVFLLFLLYGLSLITLAFLMSVLLKKPFLTGLAVFLLTIFWGSLGFTALYRHLPAFMEWSLCLLSPFAFTAGMAQLIHLDYDVNSNANLDSPNNSYLIIANLFMLILDAFLYLVLALYFDKILLSKYGHRRSPLFFLKSSYWFQHRRANNVVLENETDSDPPLNDSFEPVPPEFQGKEAIRIRNLRKEYTGKHGKVEALKGLGFDIYEGQITALLGHSGAGKTTLINTLCGLSPPTTGSVTIYNQTLSEMDDFDAVVKLTGVCPQSNIQFGFLTVRENLRLFAKIKGILPHEVEQEVQRVLRDLEMENIQDILAQSLSGGQKRKLTFGIAILGDPQVLLLDEPTAGLDPLSRHRIWNLLKERKVDRVIVFSTQFMDEADILADRKVFISNGRLRCAGSSLFLKKKWGIGYHLSLHLNEICDPESVTSLVKKHIPDARVTTQSEERLVFILPLERTNKFPDLYRELDRCSNQGIENYGVSMTTLNEVFLKLEGKSMTDESDIGSSGHLESEGAEAMGSLAELEQMVSSRDSSGDMKSGMALWRQQLCAVAKVRFLKLKKERKSLMTVLLLFGISFLPQVLGYLIYELQHENYSWGLSPSMYFLAPGQPPQDPLTHLLVINKTGSSIDNFVHSLRQQSIAVDIDVLGTGNGTEEVLYNGAITVSGDEKDLRFSIACNTKRLNCFPVLVDIISNGLLGIFNSSERIQTDRSTFVEEHMIYEHEHLNSAFFWIPLAASLTPYIAMSSISDYKRKVLSQLWISGLYPSAYWCGQALVDIPLYFSILFLMQIMEHISYDSMDYLGASESQVMFLALISPRSCHAFPNPEEPGEEDEDVQMERTRTADAVTALQMNEKPVIIASCLRKEYAGKKKKCFSKTKKKIATRNISFCVKKGEVLGLLGHNGAGKSTTISMITGDTKPTAGQENLLWPVLTVKEHLEVYAAVKGLKKKDAMVAITRLANALKLQDQLKAPVKTLSEGVKRKLCFVLSILGNPSVVLLDEPSTGMDPEGQQQMWQAIRATFTNTERGALLTTHYMAEAEAVCDRVAIMVSGRLRCIGSIQHLKSKFGKDYLLEMKVKTLTQVESLNTEIMTLFPQAARQERYSSLMVYKLPVEDVRPLSQAFFHLERLKENFDLEEYSLSQSTLEQVFLELSKEQELDDLDEELDSSVKWKLLPQEEP
ncbi:ATP-binding cassette sub-family A member 9 [Microtus ochrogaster]|uniref:ATP-binding cassette sub-family A member 9 n=1 Tax=Microtus ochrogaster TaxID=79684 RepID=A0A8J6GGP5_MICOH|nr:ATP-binding cassette sub-family A member 9 [Microtus ochrogaster]